MSRCYGSLQAWIEAHLKPSGWPCQLPVQALRQDAQFDLLIDVSEKTFVDTTVGCGFLVVETHGPFTYLGAEVKATFGERNERRKPRS